jgi:hypothetical protein
MAMERKRFVEDATQRSADLLDADLLLLGHGVLGRTVSADAADVADADTVFVVAASVGALTRNGPAAFHGAVKAHNVMVADVCPAASKVPAADVVSSNVTPRGRSAAVQDYALDVPHFSFFWMMYHWPS